MNTTLHRLVTTATSTAVLTATTFGPAFAGSKNDDGEERGNTFSTTESFLLFVVTPLAFIALTTVLVYAPSWMKKARVAARGGFLDDPTAADALPSERKAISH